MVSNAKQTRRGPLYQIGYQLQNDENPPLVSEQWPLDRKQTIQRWIMIYASYLNMIVTPEGENSKRGIQYVRLLSLGIAGGVYYYGMIRRYIVRTA